MNISAQNIDFKFWHISNRPSNLWADIDFVLLARCVPHEEGVGSRLLEQVELHAARPAQPLPERLGLLRVKLARTGVTARGAEAGTWRPAANTTWTSGARRSLQGGKYEASSL